ncbi:MAG: tetratricopeptide repeat protein [Myxococcota bacterium]
MTSRSGEGTPLRRALAAGRSRDAAIALALCALTFAVYFQVRNHAFVDYDDRVYILDNPNLRDGPSLKTIARSFREPYETNWIPLTWVSLQLDHALFGSEPAGYLLENVALHALSALLLYLALARMTGARWPSCFVAAVFAVHPLHVESVAWAAERKDTLSGMFWMATMVAYAHHAARPGMGRMALVAASFSAGLMAKPMLVSLPLVLLLLDHWPLGRLRRDKSGAFPPAGGPRRVLLEKLPLFALAGAASAVTLAVQRAAGAMSHDHLLPLSVRLSNAVVSYAAYLRDSLWPVDLAVFYPHPLSLPPPGTLLVASSLLVGISALALRWAGTRPYFAVGWLWFLLTLVPVIGIVQAGMQARADRYTYLPQIGLTIAAAWGAHEASRSRALRRVLAAVGAGAIAALAVTAWNQVGHWRDSRALFARAVSVTQDNFVAHHGLGEALLEAGDPEAALAQFLRARAIKPRWPDARVGEADARLALGQLEPALEGYRRALELDPTHATALAKSGRALAASGRTDEAIQHYRRALRLFGDAPPAALHAYLGAALADIGDDAGAEQQFERAIAIRPDYARAHHYLGMMRLRTGRFSDAREPLRIAASLLGESAELHASQAAAARGAGDARAALEHYRAARRLRPGWEVAANNLAWILATHPDANIRDPAEAVRIAETLQRAGGAADPLRYDTLAAAYAAAGQFERAARTAAEAARLARRDGPEDLIVQIEERAAGYRSNRPFIDPEWLRGD